MNFTNISSYCHQREKCKSGLNLSLKKKYKYYTIFPFIIAILPKCPFCILAYSSTVVLCGNTTGVSQNSIIHYTLSSLSITLLLCSIIIVGIAFNYKGTKTLKALLLAFVGIAFIVTSLMIGGGMYMYYTGTSLLFFSVWLNGSFFYFFRKIKEYIKRRKKYLPKLN